MKDKYHLSKTETEIMEKLWKIGEPVKQTELLAIFNEEGKEWGRQTLNTLLIRLEQRGFVKREKRTVQAVFNQQDFGTQIMYEATDNYYHGHLNGIFAAFARDKRYTKKDAEELKQMITEYIEAQNEE